MKSGNFKWLSALPLLLTLWSCAGVGVLQSSDPQKKIHDAVSLMGVGRHVLAAKLLKEAIEIYKSHPDDWEEARANALLGEVYRDGRSPWMPDYPKAATYFETAAKIYHKMGKLKWEAFNLYAEAHAQAYKGRQPDVCQTLKKSKEVYRSAPDFDKLTETFERAGAFSFASYPNLLRTFACKTDL